MRPLIQLRGKICVLNVNIIVNYYSMNVLYKMGSVLVT